MKVTTEELLFLLAVVMLATETRTATAAPAAAPPAPAPRPATAHQVHAGEQLEPGAHYHATIKLEGLEAMFGTAAAVKAKLEGAGFADVVVTDKGGGSFEASGKWAGAAVAAKLPSQVTSVERVG